MTYNLSFPGKTIFGNGSIENLAAELPQRAKLLLVVGKHVKQSGLLNRITQILSSFEIVTLCGVQAEPPLSAVDEIITLGRSNNVSAIVAVGGGSVIDAAKAAAAIVPLDGGISDYFYGGKSIPWERFVFRGFAYYRRNWH